MPLYYTVLSKRSKADKHGEGETTWHEIQTNSLLVKTPEPDFSMPFNVNAVTNAVVGFVFINAFYTIVKPKRFV